MNGDPPDTAELVARAAAGDRDAFRTLVDRYHRIVHRWALVSLGDADEAEDVTQIVLIKVLDGLASYRGGGRFTTWLYVVTRNVILENTRLRLRREKLMEREESLSPQSDVVVDSADLDSTKFVETVRAVLNELPPRQREIFQLADLDGFSAAEVAAMLGVEPVTVRTNLLKARRAVRTRMLRDQGKLIEEFRS